MRQLLIPRLRTRDGHDETMRVAIIEALRRIIRPIIKIQQPRNASHHARHRLKAFRDAGFGDVRFELEAAVMFDLGQGQMGG